MTDPALIWAWLEFALRWLHVITAIAWIGASFYFVALDLGLRRGPDVSEDLDGEDWQMHGGRVYHIRKYPAAPPEMPEHLVWFKWESYATWATGVALLAVVYWVGGELYLIDAGKADIALWQGVTISALSLILGWVIYDALCKSPLGDRPTALMVALFLLIVAAAWGYDQLFTGRAALLHLGAFTATLMTANVAHAIIPNQRKILAELKANRTPDPDLGRIARQRLTHNSYLTLPVIFLMLSNHYPLAFASDYNWLIASLVFLIGVAIRHYFNTRNARAGNPFWPWAAAILLFILIMWLSAAPLRQEAGRNTETAELTAAQTMFASAAGYDEVQAIVQGRCTMCHARAPVWDGIARAPGDILLETTGDITRLARQVYISSGITRAMPPANITHMAIEERAAIAAWYRAATARATLTAPKQ